MLTNSSIPAGVPFNFTWCHWTNTCEISVNCNCGLNLRADVQFLCIGHSYIGVAWMIFDSQWIHGWITFSWLVKSKTKFKIRTVCLVLENVYFSHIIIIRFQLFKCQPRTEQISSWDEAITTEWEMRCFSFLALLPHSDIINATIRCTIHKFRGTTNYSAVIVSSQPKARKSPAFEASKKPA